MPQGKNWFFAGLFVYSLVCRLLPYVLFQFGAPIDPEQTWYPWNFAPLTAVCLFGGACLADRRWSFGLMLAVLALSDLGIFALTGRADWVFTRSQVLIYLCFALTVALGLLLRGRACLATGVPAGLISESVFFLVTNFAVWWLGDGNRYPLTAAGLWTCYVAALPFFGRSLLSTAAFTGVLFSPLGLRLAGVAPAAGASVPAPQRA